jgi:hypothetical protein
MKNLFVLFAIGFLVNTVFSQFEGNPPNWCRAGFFTKESKDFRPFKVKGTRTSKTYFFNDDGEGCPGKNCRGKAYIVGGDELIVSRSLGDYSCAWYSPKKGYDTVGWIETSKLIASEFSRRPALASWLGEWKYADNSINFTENRLAGYLNVTGDAMWKGLGDNVHVGELDGRFEPKGSLLEYSDGDSEYDCKVTMRMIGKFLIVADNMRCGGANVSFSGVYLRVKKY